MNEMRKLMETVESLDEGASSEQWEIAINNLIGDGDNKFAIAGATIEEKNTWNWVRNELHGMLDYQPDDVGENITEVDDMASDNSFFGEEELEETEISAEWGQVVGDKLYRREGFEDAKNGVYRPEAYGKGPARDSYRAGKEEWVELMAQER